MNYLLESNQYTKLSPSLNTWFIQICLYNLKIIRYLISFTKSKKKIIWRQTIIIKQPKNFYQATSLSAFLKSGVKIRPKGLTVSKTRSKMVTHCPSIPNQLGHWLLYTVQTSLLFNVCRLPFYGQVRWVQIRTVSRHRSNSIIISA